MKNFAKFLLVIFLSSSAMPFRGADQRTNWTSNVRIDELGQADLDKTYNQLLDFLLPRQIANPADVKCFFVLRFIPANGTEHQLNIVVPESSSSIQILRMELRDSLQLSLDRSDRAQTLASTSVVKKTELSGNAEIQELLESAERNGLPFRIPPGVALHGDTYKLWMSCELNNVEFTTVIPERTHTPVSDWMNRVWSETVKLSGRTAPSA